MTTRTVLHEWLNYTLADTVTTHRDAGSLEIGLAKTTIPTFSEVSASEDKRLARAAEIALGLDATVGRSLREGGTAKLQIRRPRPSSPVAPRDADEATAMRPSVEALIAPLVFGLTPGQALRPFQMVGVQWLIEHRTGILADDMGLGKTAQALRALASLVVEGEIASALVICPKSLLANWESECTRWVPELTVIRCVPSKRHAEGVWSALLGRVHIIITSYEQLRPLPAVLRSTHWDLVIADEAHRLRRSQAGLVKAFRLMDVGRFWALTGTPIERHEIDLATLLSLLAPSRFSGKSAESDLLGLRARAQPYILRRLKTDVLRELPEIIDTKELLELSPQQQREYSAARSEPLPKDTGQVLQRITLLRSICDVATSTDASVKLDRVVQILQAIQEAGEKAVVFSYLLRPLEILSARLSGADRSLRAVKLTGELSIGQRARVVNEFKADPGIVALLCSSRVGGEGLTLTEANHVIFINEWWNPSANSQARDRVVRIGQRRIVHVHRFRCKGTIEEVLEQILRRKNETFANVVDALATGAPVTEVEAQALLAEVGSEIGPISS